MGTPERPGYQRKPLLMRETFPVFADESQRYSLSLKGSYGRDSRWRYPSPSQIVVRLAHGHDLTEADKGNKGSFIRRFAD